jgi:hypothetical protein
MTLSAIYIGLGYIDRLLIEVRQNWLQHTESDPLFASRHAKWSSLLVDTVVVVVKFAPGHRGQ